MRVRSGVVRLDVVGKNSLILGRVLTSLLIISIYLGNIGGCGGGGNEPVPPEVEEFTLFMNVTQIELSDGFGSPCPESSAVLELQLELVDEQVSGQATLIGFGMMGNATELSGLVEGESIVIDAFSVSVDDGRPVDISFPSGPSEINLSFDRFTGTLIYAGPDQMTFTLEVEASGSVGEVKDGDIPICSGNFTMKRSAEDCLPYLFVPYINGCIAESIAKLCEPLWCDATVPIIETVEISFSSEANRFSLDNLEFEQTSITFDEPEFFPMVPIDGISLDGVTFLFTVGGEPSEDAVIGSGVGNTPLMSPPMIEGSTSGLVTLVFDPLVKGTLAFDFALSTANQFVPVAVSVTPFDESGQSFFTTKTASASAPGGEFLFPEGTLEMELPALDAIGVLGGPGSEVISCDTIQGPASPPVRYVSGSWFLVTSDGEIGEEISCH